MKKVNILFSILIGILLITLVDTPKVYGQCAISAAASSAADPTPKDTAEICIGEAAYLTSAGACGYLMINNFNNGTVGVGWSSNASPMFNNPCPPLIPPASGIVCWIGSATNFPRQLTTIAYNLGIGSGYTIDWDMKYGDIQSHQNCEDPDQPNEGVHLQWSTNGGMTWADMNYWTPTNNITGPLYTWNHYTQNVLPIALSPTTQFRWYQDLTSGFEWDHWGIDNVEITCASGINTTVLWNTGDTIFNIVVYPTTSQQYYVTVSDSMFSAADTVYVKVHPIPTADFTATSPICSDYDTTTIQYTGTASPSATYFWNIDQGITFPGTGPGPHIIPGLFAGTYTVSLSVEEHNCVSLTDTFEITVNQLPLISFKAEPYEGCVPLTVTFSDNSIPTIQDYKWFFGTGDSSILADPVYMYEDTGTYTIKLIATSYLGCYDSYTAEDYISVYPNPIADFYADPLIVKLDTEPINFTSMSTGADFHDWDFGDGNSSTDSVTSNQYEETGTFDVILLVTTKHGCTDTISLSVEVIEDDLTFPNVFTPNGDGYNDRFVIENLETYLFSNIMIYNRWGKKIYEKDNYQNDWDGEGAADGVYYYVLTYKGKLSEGEVNGTVTIVR